MDRFLRPQKKVTVSPKSPTFQFMTDEKKILAKTNQKKKQAV